MESKRREGFDAVYLEYRDEVFQTAVLCIHNPSDAEDIAQEVFVRYYIYTAHSIVANPRSWLLTTSKNLARNYMKHAQYERLLDRDESMELLMEREPDVEDVFFGKLWKKEIYEYTDMILEAVKSRNKKWYDALMYAYCMEMPRRDIAECMGITLNALEGILKRAKNWIKDNYRDEYDHIARA